MPEANWTKDEAKVVRKMIQHEGNLINYRLTWLATLQGFLFAALGFAWEKNRWLMVVLAIVGIGSSLSVFASVWIAHSAARSLEQEWKDNRSDEYIGPHVAGHSAERSGLLLMLLMPWFFLPVLLIVAWLLLLFTKSV